MLFTDAYDVPVFQFLCNKISDLHRTQLLCWQAHCLRLSLKYYNWLFVKVQQQLKLNEISRYTRLELNQSSRFRHSLYILEFLTSKTLIAYMKFSSASDSAGPYNYRKMYCRDDTCIYQKYTKRLYIWILNCQANLVYQFFSPNFCKILKENIFALFS